MQRMQKSQERKLPLVAVFGLVMLFGSRGLGSTVFSASDDVTVTFDGYYDSSTGSLVSSMPGGLTISTTLDSPLQVMYAAGAGTASASASSAVSQADPSAFQVGDSFALNTAVSGTTTTAADTSGALASSAGELALQNNGTSALTLAFTLSYTAGVTATSDTPGEIAFGAASTLVFGFLSNPTFLSASTPPDASGFPFAFPAYLNLADAGLLPDHPGTYNDSNTLSFSYQIGPNTSDVLAVGATSLGDPFSLVPEPSSGALAAIGLIGLAACGWIRHRADAPGAADA